LLSTRYAGRNPYTVYLVDLFVTPPARNQNKQMCPPRKSKLRSQNTKRTQTNKPFFKSKRLPFLLFEAIAVIVKIRIVPSFNSIQTAKNL
ncbi:hypothetical protein, partial [Microcoleus sp. K5-D4]|uniref:hypothetical protein n=1 Tax=Microcoleus sp. K5-D4 TaxID=2818801 RepID=UPI002FCFFF4B